MGCSRPVHQQINGNFPPSESILSRKIAQLQAFLQTVGRLPELVAQNGSAAARSALADFVQDLKRSQEATREFGEFQRKRREESMKEYTRSMMEEHRSRARYWN